jgi:hypothetical protein
MRIFYILFLLVFLTSPVTARDLADVNIPEELTVENGLTLHLNGAGIRNKLFFKIYIAELYMQHPSSDVVKVVGDEGQKRIVMHFLYDEVKKDKLVEAWNEGFRANIDQQILVSLQKRIDQFNAMFDDVKKGDEVLLDFIPGKGTQVTIRKQVKGVVAGKDFNDALLSIWLGKEPVSAELRRELLDYSKKK